MLTAERVTDTERHVAEITERGYTVVHGVLAQEEVEEFLGDTRRLQRELPTVIANSTTVVKGFRRKGQAVPEVVDHDWVRIDNLLLHGERYERLPVHPCLLPVVEGVLGRDCLLSWCMTSNQLPGAVAQRMHCDDEMYPLPRPHRPLLCNALIALCDFTAENGAPEDEPVAGFRGSLDSGRGPLMYFTNRDIHCTVDGQTVAALTSGGRQQVRCRLLHNFTSSSLAQMTAPGPLMLHVRVQGQRDALGAVRYCINATDDFWRAFLASQSRSSRLILNPQNCR